MCVTRDLVRLFLILVFVTIKAEYLTINWNISTVGGNSHIEREYKYPMYEDIAPAPCDLTDSCDVFCPQDPDCDEAQKSSFGTTELDRQCDDPIAVFDCGCKKLEKPEWLSVFCYVYKNPIYLGKFFETESKIEKLSALKNLIVSKRLSFFNSYQDDGKFKAATLNLYGSPIMTFVPLSESFPSVSPLMIKAPLKDLSYACKSKHASYGFNNSGVCLTKVTQRLCENSYVLSVLPYMVQGSNISTDSNIPIVVKDLSILKGIKTQVAIKCVDLKQTTKKFKNQDVTYFQRTDTKPCDDLITYQTLFEDNTCQNVLVYVQHDFILNGSDIVELNVEYGLADVPVNDNDKFSDVSSIYVFLKQNFGVSFFDVGTKFNDRRNFSRDDELLNRGYFVGEELNFGYKHTENSSTSWEKGLLGVFRNGDSCDNFSPITFGFDYFSACHVGNKFSNCSQIRATAEEKFDALLQGDTLATYSNLRAPYNNSVPLLRSYGNSSRGTFGNFTGCSVPAIQDVRIQYTSVLTESGSPVHRVLGVRIDRTFRNVSANADLLLTSRVFFSFVSSAKSQPRSRFWERMLSPESSENSWLHIFNAFDDVTPSEREEITFWCVLLAVLSSAAAACVRLDVNFGECFSGVHLVSLSQTIFHCRYSFLCSSR